ncbi:MAG: hypothetical protein HC826_00545, partial [Rhodospirillales bacterium]|nr:hypothetical protein [Rhodospirillales bacterium]
MLMIDGIDRAAKEEASTARRGSSQCRAKGKEDIQTQLEDLDDSELRMQLTEWKRWLSRVYQAQSMNKRRERFEVASAFIRAIEEELAFRK